VRIGIDLGGTKIEAAIIDGEGKPRWRKRLPAVSATTSIINDKTKNHFESAYQQTLDTIAELLRQAEIAEPAIKNCPIGMGTPGAECADGTLKNCNSVWLNGQPLRQDLENRLQRLVRLANDANCFALAEAHMGAARHARSVFGVILGTGVGGGFVLNGQVHQGVNHIAGEWGHNRLPVALPEDERSEREIPELSQRRSCYCGRHNCVETFLSGPGLSHSYFLASNHQCSAEQVIQKMQEGDAIARDVWQQYIQQLSRALGQVINVIDPEVIVLGGGMSNIAAIYSLVPQFWSPYIFSDTINNQLKKAELGDSAGVFGAAWLW